MSGAGRRVGAEFEFDFVANVHRSNPLKVRGRSRRWAIGIVRHAQNFKLRAHSYPVYGARLAKRCPPMVSVKIQSRSLVEHGCPSRSLWFEGERRFAVSEGAP